MNTRPKLTGQQLLAATEIVVEEVGKQMLNQDAYVSPHEMFGFLSVAHDDFRRRLKDSSINKIEVEELKELLLNIAVEAIASIGSLYAAGESQSAANDNVL